MTPDPVSAGAAARGATIGAAGLAALGGPLRRCVGARKGVVDFNIALLFAFARQSIQVGGELAVVGRSRWYDGESSRDSPPATTAMTDFNRIRTVMLL